MRYITDSPFPITPETVGYRRFLGAMLNLALSDLVAEIRRYKRFDDYIIEISEPGRWLFSDDMHPMSCAWCCVNYGLSQESLMSAIRKNWREMVSAASASSSGRNPTVETLLGDDEDTPTCDEEAEG